MKKLLVLFTIALIAVNSSAQVKWINKNIFEQKNFIENKGQFESKLLPNGEAILFSAKIDGVQYFFTKSGYTVARKELVPKTEEEMEKEEQAGSSAEGEDKNEVENKYKFVEKFHELKFDAANVNVTVVTENEVSNYYSYGDAKSANRTGTIIAHAYKKITYKNIYPNIDVEFEFPKDEIGIEYSLILHQGADINNVKISFPDKERFSFVNKSIEVESSFGKITHHQPSTFTLKDRAFVNSKFVIKNNEIGFEIGNYNHTQTLIIDPWTVTPNFGTVNGSAFDVDYDSQGNVYAYGGVGPFELVKYNSAGTLAWTFTPAFLGSYYYYGDFAVDRNSNSIYLTEGFNNAQGAGIVKINASATVLATFTGNSQFNEMWRIAFSRCTGKAVVAGGGVSSPTYQTCLLDTTLANITPIQFVNTTNCCHDVGAMALDNNGNVYEIKMLRVADSLFDNALVKLPIPSLLPITYSVPTHYSFREAASSMYYSTAGATVANGYNGMTTSGNYVYTYDGYVLKKWDGPTGNLLVYQRISLPPANDSSVMNWGGISADDCGNLFLGDNTFVRQYDSNLLLVNSYPMTGTFTDVMLSNSGIIYVSGLSYVATVNPTNIVYCQNSSAPTLSVSVINASCNSSGSATAIVAGGTPPYNITWSTIPPQHGLSITNVPAGTYTVSILYGNCNPQQIIDTLVINTSGGGIVATTSATIQTCGSNNGTATCNVIQGVSPYTYLWDNGQTTPTATGLTAGTYTCLITDSVGCTTTQTAIIATNYSLSLNYIANTICTTNTGTATVFVYLGIPPYSYAWSNGQTTPTATGLNIGTDTCIVIDSAGCTQLLPVTILPPAIISLTINSNPSQCNGATGTATANPSNGALPYTYLWSNGSTTQSLYNLGVDTLSCIVTDNNGCTQTDSVITTTSYPVTVYVTPLNPVCVTDPSFLLTFGYPSFGAYYGNGVISFNHYFDPSVAGIGVDTIIYVYSTGACLDSIITTITVNGCFTGITETNNANNITIYPNPFTSQTTISFSAEQKNTRIYIRDVLGKEIRKETFSGKQFIIEKGDLSNGIYFLQIVDEYKNTVNKKIIIQ